LGQGEQVRTNPCHRLGANAMDACELLWRLKRPVLTPIDQDALGEHFANTRELQKLRPLGRFSNAAGVKTGQTLAFWPRWCFRLPSCQRFHLTAGTPLVSILRRSW
jgi:hypothetical protein